MFGTVNYSALLHNCTETCTISFFSYTKGIGTAHLYAPTIICQVHQLESQFCIVGLQESTPEEPNMHQHSWPQTPISKPPPDDLTLPLTTPPQELHAGSALGASSLPCPTLLISFPHHLWRPPLKCRRKPRFCRVGHQTLLQFCWEDHLRFKREVKPCLTQFPLPRYSVQTSSDVKRGQNLEARATTPRLITWGWDRGQDQKNYEKSTK